MYYFVPCIWIYKIKQMPRKQHIYHYIYKTTCKVTRKFYIGMHSTSNLEDGYLGSGKILKRSLNKYGPENHSKEILEFLPDRNQLKEREKNLIDEDLLHENLCMNIQFGGHGGGVLNTVNVKDKDGNRFRVNKEDPRYLSGELVGVNKGRNVNSKENNPRFGKKLTDKERDSVSKSNLAFAKEKGKAKLKEVEELEENSNIVLLIRSSDGKIKKRIRYKFIKKWLNEGWWVSAGDSRK